MKEIHFWLDSDQEYLNSLFEKIRSGDSNAFAAYYGKTYPGLYRQFYQRTGEIYVVQDLLREFYRLSYRELMKGKPGNPKKAVVKWRNAVLEGLQEIQLQDRRAMRSLKEMQPDTAELLLMEILEEIGLPEHTMPLLVVRTYDEYHEQRFTLERFMAIVVIGMMAFVAFLLK